MASDPVLHCWEDGPRGEWGELPGSTCMLEDGHDGPHEFTPDNRIGVSFAPGIEALKGVQKDTDA